MDDNSRRAAQAARLPMVDGTTESGLPRRPPQANLLPGAAAEEFGLDRELSVSREPEEVRGRLERFAVGRELARLEESEPLLPPNPMTAASPLASSPVRAPAPPTPPQPRATPATPVPPAAPPAPPAPSVLPAPPPGALSPLPAGWDEPWGDGWRSFRPGRP
ncbi:hypothetical protein [Embleya hyalina]|uniref:Histidine kinase n=1 Tax=Embleya hyalina TaxID=516124 RepID=A0A401Z2L8_9ACTN|nr:hypothetical protein [Embleya hyalina]GCE01133.1 histidine kinase [Embleya hyalina]